MKKPKAALKKKFNTFSFLIFLILIVIIPNLFYRLAIDLQLEIRLLALSFFLGILFSPLIFIKKRGLLKAADLRILRNPAILVYATLILIIGISIFWATNKSEAIYEFLKRAVFFVLFLYLIIFVLQQEKSRIYLTKAFVIFSIIISLTGIIQIVILLSGSKYSIEFIYLIKGNFAQKNIFSEVLFITFAFSVYGISILERMWKKASVTGALLTLLLIGFLMTRAIWTGFFVSLCVTLLLYLLYASKAKLTKKLKFILRTFAILTGLVFFVIVIIALTDKNETIKKHLINTTNVKEGNTFHRLNLWKKSLSLAQKNPLLGVGAGNWRIEILQYDLQIETDKGRTMPDRAHNDYLQVLVENGIIGFIPFLLLFVLMLYFCIRVFKKADNLQDSFFILILFFALVGYMVDSFFSFPRERIELQIFLNIIFAYIVFEYNKCFQKEAETKSQSSIRPFALIIFVLLTVTCYAAYKRLKSEAGVKRIYTYVDLKNDDQVIKTTNEIYSAFSTITPYGDPILEIRAVSLFQKDQDLSLVLETFDQSLKDSPHYLKTYYDLAGVYLYRKNYSKALEYSNIALKYSPNDIKSKIIKSGILLTTDKIDEAYSILRTINPSVENNEYKNAVNYILYKKTTNLISQSKNEYLNSQILINAKKSGFLYKIYSTSIEKNEEFEKTLLDRVLSICKQDKIASDQSVKELKIKYKLKK